MTDLHLSEPPLAKQIASRKNRVSSLMSEMTLEEKIGQLQQLDASATPAQDWLLEAVRQGRVGSVINQTDVKVSNHLQDVAVNHTRLGIPLINGRDVIHGFRTVFPIPLGQAASFNPDLVRLGARYAALEARRHGVHWTFAPMIDISRDPRWGRIAESFGEDPVLTADLGKAMVDGFQNGDLSNPESIAACAKHFAGYGASESGRDYNTTNIPENELRNIYLPPFKAVADAGAATFMSSFSDLDGVPASANAHLLREILREEWGFDGMVVSDWDAIRELIVHGLSATPREAALEAATAGIDMEMTGDAYANHLAELISDGLFSMAQLDAMVENVLRLKERLGLFDNPFAHPEEYPELLSKPALAAAQDAATQSLVLLKNDDQVLPLNTDALSSIAVIGPLADAPHEQMGTWTFDGQADDSYTPLKAIEDAYGNQLKIHHASGLTWSRQRDTAGFDEAETVARDSDVALVFLGEESILSGEAHSRADITLPGAQSELLARLRATGTPIVAVILAGRPLVLTDDLAHCDAVIYGWHPGTMGGPAIRDVLFGLASPSGKLPVTFPRAVGQVPIYYNRKATGRPSTESELVLIDDIEIGAQQTSLGNTTYHLDAGIEPLFPFGFGLSYTQFEISELTLSTHRMQMSDTLKVCCKLANIGQRKGTEVVQLYIHDQFASLTRPVRELKAYQRVDVDAGETCEVTFELTADDLAFYRRDKTFGAEPGTFQIWVGQCAVGGATAHFELIPD